VVRLLRQFAAEYRCWHGIKTRCYNARNRSFAYYGARGIRMSEEWRQSFAAFLRDMGPRPSPQHTIERIDNDGHYEPGNCRWATKSDQQWNSRQTRLLTHAGMTLPLSVWAGRLCICPNTLRLRLKRHPVSVALAVPRQPRGGKGKSGFKRLAIAAANGERKVAPI